MVATLQSFALFIIILSSNTKHVHLLIVSHPLSCNAKNKTKNKNIKNRFEIKRCKRGAVSKREDNKGKDIDCPHKN